MRASVLIPTFRRPESFLRAARSVIAQRGVGAFELIGVDNSPEGSALESFRALERAAPIPFRWTHEPRAGVAHARNAALALAQGGLIAWLDDDEEAPPHWLAALIAQRAATGAQSVFGPVRIRAPGEAADVEFYERLYARLGPHASGFIPRAYGMGNSLQPRAMFDAGEFSAAANETGGEDDALFARWAEAGARFAWANDAEVTEHLTAERLTLAHGFKRAFAYGQAPCETAFAGKRWGALARHVGIGAGQALVYGLAAAAAAPVSRAAALAMADRAARGAGKVLWFKTQRFYGEALAKQAA